MARERIDETKGERARGSPLLAAPAPGRGKKGSTEARKDWTEREKDLG